LAVRPRALKAIEHGYRVLFATGGRAESPRFTKAATEGALEERLKLYTVPRLLIVDEIGLPPHRPRRRQSVLPAHQPDATSAGRMILTSNQSFGSWGDVFGDPVMRHRDPSIASCTTPSPSTSGATPTG